MPQKKVLLALVIGAVALAGGALYLKKSGAPGPGPAPTKASSPGSTPETGKPGSATRPVQPLVLELAPSDLALSETREVRRELPLTGQLRPLHTALVRAKVAGEVVEMRVKEGDTVTNGQVLARIDAAEYKARLDERLATLAATRATWENNERTRKNNEELLRKGFISQSAYDNTLANSTVALAQVKAADANVALAKKSLDDAVVRAPWAGVIAERTAQTGDRAAIDGRLLTLVNLSQMEIEAAVPASDIPNVSVGQDVNFTVEGFGGRAFQGKIARVSPQSQGGSRSIMVYIGVPNPDGALKGGMFAKGNLTLTQRVSVIAIPIAALREERGETVVYALENGRISRLAVKPGTRNEDQAWVEVTQGLAAGVRVIKSNLGTLSPGVEARIVEATSASAAAPAAVPTAVTPGVPPAVPPAGPTAAPSPVPQATPK